MSANDKTGLGYDSQLSKKEMPKCEIFEIAYDSSVSEIDEDNNQAKDRYKVGIGYHAIPPPYTGNYMPPRADLSFAGLDDSVFKITDRGNEEDGPDLRARGDRFYHNRRSVDRGNEKMDHDPGIISEMKGLR
nr:hypothetical protein [Tanacetum cinerariifolium]